MRRTRPRRGYAMVIVVLFVTLFLTLWASATRQIGTMLRIEQARSKRIARDGRALSSTRALSQGLGAMELGFPPANAYSCVVFVDGNSFLLNFNRQGDTTWSVAASAGGGSPTLDLANFQPTPPPVAAP